MAWLAEAEFPLERCRDVFLALPQMVLDEDRAIRGVIVCVDEVLPEEFEFFSLAGRHRPDVEVLVYSRWGESVGVQSALRQGAKVCTPAAVRRLAEKLRAGERPRDLRSQVSDLRFDSGLHAQTHEVRDAEPGSEAGKGETQISALGFERPTAASTENGSAGASPSRTRPATAAPSLGDSARGESADRVAEPADVAEAAEREAVSEGPVGPDETTPSARVPWIRYQDAPVRGRPAGGAGKAGAGRPKPPASPDDAAQTPGSAESDVNRTSGLSGESEAIGGAGAERSGPGPLPERVAAPWQAGEAPAGFEPLLTEEELAALMSDDFEGLVAEERESLLDDLGERP